MKQDRAGLTPVLRLTELYRWTGRSIGVMEYWGDYFTLGAYFGYREDNAISFSNTPILQHPITPDG
jgi:hypothetical protein